MADVRLSAKARADIAEILAWTTDHFGAAATERYQRLIASALKHLRADPKATGSKARPEIMIDARIYHLRHGKGASGVTNPRHLLVYRVDLAGDVDVGRVLHEAMEPALHGPFDFSNDQ